MRLFFALRDGFFFAEGWIFSKLSRERERERVNKILSLRAKTKLLYSTSVPSVKER